MTADAALRSRRARLRSSLLASIVLLTAAACGADETTAAATAGETAGTSLIASRSAEPPSPTPPVEPSQTAATDAPRPPASPAAGIALQDVDVQRLLDAFESYGYERDPEPRVADDGANLWTAAADDGEVELVVREVEGTVERVLVADYSAGAVGLDDLGFLIGIFAPEAQDWLIANVEAAIADPGTPISDEMAFENVRLTFEAYTDQTQSIDLYVEPPED